MYKERYDDDGHYVGTFDGQFLHSLSGKVLFREEADEIYSNAVPAKGMGTMAVNWGRNFEGAVLCRMSNVLSQ